MSTYNTIPVALGWGGLGLFRNTGSGNNGGNENCNNNDNSKTTGNLYGNIDALIYSNIMFDQNDTAPRRRKEEEVEDREDGEDTLDN